LAAFRLQNLGSHIRKLILFLILTGILAAESPVLSITKNRLADKGDSPPRQETGRTNSSRQATDHLHRNSAFKTDLSFLFWQGQEDGFEFAANNSPGFPLNANIPTDISASISTVDFSWVPAFKLLLGYQFSDPSWDLNVRWTWFQSRSRRSLSEPLSNSGGGLLPLWIPPQAALSTFPVYSHAKGALHLLLNQVDIELAYLASISRAFFLNLHGGLKGISISQVFNAKYNDGFSDGVNQMLESHAQAKSRCRGLGPRVGVGSKWTFLEHWSLIAEAAGALALSDMRTKREDRSIGTTAGVLQEVAVKFREAFWVWRPVIEGNAGLQWEYRFGCKKDKILDLGVLYEIQEYWEQNMMTRYTDSAIFYAAYPNRGNLTLHGFSLTLALGY
jgi:hypothetical protein